MVTGRSWMRGNSGVVSNQHTHRMQPVALYTLSQSANMPTFQIRVGCTQDPCQECMHAGLQILSPGDCGRHSKCTQVLHPVHELRMPSRRDCFACRIQRQTRPRSARALYRQRMRAPLWKRRDSRGTRCYSTMAPPASRALPMVHTLFTSTSAHTAVQSPQLQLWRQSRKVQLKRSNRGHICARSPGRFLARCGKGAGAFQTAKFFKSQGTTRQELLPFFSARGAGLLSTLHAW